MKAALSCSVSIAMPVRTSAHSAIISDLHSVRVHTWSNCVGQGRVHFSEQEMHTLHDLQDACIAAKKGNRITALIDDPVS